MGKITERLKRRYAERAGSSPATKEDLSKMRRELDNNLRKAMASDKPSGRQIAGRAARMAKKGFGNIEKSLASPSDNRRPRISQLPARRGDIGIVQGGLGKSLEYLKPPGLRGQTISGRKEKK